jgi:hypothetical protein
MMHEFMAHKNTGLRFEKVGENSYIIGTRKVQAKVNGGILLVRVGGGFIDIDSFFKQYGDLELAKQKRQDNKDEKLHQEQQERLSLDNLTVAKKAT